MRCVCVVDGLNGIPGRAVCFCLWSCFGCGVGRWGVAFVEEEEEDDDDGSQEKIGRGGKAKCSV